MNVLLILIDALRVDHLGISGYCRDTSPNIDRLAKDGVFFRNAFSTIARTDPSIISLFTGKYPHSTGVRFLTDRYDNSSPTIPEILHEKGYYALGQDVEMIGAGLDAGFNSFNPILWRIENKAKRAVIKCFDWDYKADVAETLTDFAIGNINKLKSRNFFMYLHYIGSHWPYCPPEPYASMFDPDYKGSHDFNLVDGPVKRRDLIFNNQLPREQIEHAIAHYDGTIRHVDAAVGRLIAHLKKIGIYNDTLIILSSDHAESLGEHNLFFSHGDYLYDVELNVPLVIKDSSIKHKVINEQVQLTDIFPTVLELVNIEYKEKIDGVSLIPLIKSGKYGRKYVFAESGESYFKENKRRYFDGLKGKWRMVRTDEWKLVYIPHPDNDIYELYNVKNDPYETVNRIGTESEVFEELKQKLFLWMEKRDLNNDKTPELIKGREKVKERLKALGYLD